MTIFFVLFWGLAEYFISRVSAVSRVLVRVFFSRSNIATLYLWFIFSVFGAQGVVALFINEEGHYILPRWPSTTHKRAGVWCCFGHLYRRIYADRKLPSPLLPHSLLTFLLLEGSYSNQIHYNASHSKATSLSLAIQYIHALLSHTLTGKRVSTGVVTTTGAYYLWSMATAHVFDLAYSIALAFCHQTNYYKKGPICLGPYMTRLARHFGLFNTLEMSSTLTLVGQMSPQGISSLIHMRMIERRRGVDPPILTSSF
ncbi:hypothetical protein J1N35_041318 [Gossypium stocksii]|uniref:Uncharacterized protein n=1 Tax=Gossypium stocksii TaxID=47602 RepID=A0A9D3UFM6_9ROSI|nr:hypothetical protein J1N35_041318 [Gossypium stocksii]